MVFKAVVNLPLDLTAPLTTLPNDGNAAHLSAIKLQALQSLPGPPKFSSLFDWGPKI